MNTTSIKSEFTKFIKKTMGSDNPQMSGWYCGITNNESRRKAEHNNSKGRISNWKCIDAGSMKKANEVEAYFSSKGTRNLPNLNGAVQSSRWVYIFKLPSKNSKNYGLGGVVTDKTIYDYVFGN